MVRSSAFLLLLFLHPVVGGPVPQWVWDGPRISTPIGCVYSLEQTHLLLEQIINYGPGGGGSIIGFQYWLGGTETIYAHLMKSVAFHFRRARDRHWGRPEVMDYWLPPVRACDPGLAHVPFADYRRYISPRNASILAFLLCTNAVAAYFYSERLGLTGVGPSEIHKVYGKLLEHIHESFAYLHLTLKECWRLLWLFNHGLECNFQLCLKRPCRAILCNCLHRYENIPSSEQLEEAYDRQKGMFYARYRGFLKDVCPTVCVQGDADAIRGLENARSIFGPSEPAVRLRRAPVFDIS